MRENNPFEDTSAPTDTPPPTDQASANAMNALNEPKKSGGFLSALKGRKKDPEPTPPTASPADFTGSDTAYQPLIDENQPVAPVATPPEPAPIVETAPETFKKTPPVAIDGVSPDYNTEYSTAAVGASPPYEDIQPVAEQPYAPPAEQPMIYQQPANQYYQQPDPYQQTNQPLPVNYGTAPNIYDPYNPYATMVDLNPNAPDPAKKPDWKFVITFSIAVICFAGMIFFGIQFAAVNKAKSAVESEIIELEKETGANNKSASQVEDLQNTVRELTTKNEDLKKSNDDLKKNEDKVKELETQAKDLQTERQGWMDKYYDVLTRCGDKCASGTSSSSSSN
jgi:FtsZ-binding cell division protein ZapB